MVEFEDLWRPQHMVKEVAELPELILLKKLLNSFELSKLSTGFLPVTILPGSSLSPTWSLSSFY